MTVQELLTALQEGLEDGSWRPDSPIAIFNADSGHFHDLDGPRPHMVYSWGTNTMINVDRP